MTVRVALGPKRRWSAIGRTQATGFAFRGEALLRCEQLASLIDATPADMQPALLEELSGSFAAITERADGVDAAVDNIRGIPLFCVRDGEHRVITDDPLAAIPGVRSGASDWRCRAELLQSGIVSGADTLIDDVQQVEAGSRIEVPAAPDGAIVTHRYCAFRPNLERDTSDGLLDTAFETHRAAVARTLQHADGARIVVPLSAGLDSGILAALLARDAADPDQVVTYTYGRPGNRESEVSKRVAESLGLRWEFVPYSERTWQELARQPWWAPYLVWASSLAGSPGFSDVPAMLELRRRELIPEGSVVVPGHSLGFPAGSYIPGSLLRRRRGSRDDVIDAVLATYYKYRSNQVLAQMLGRTTDEVADATP